MLETWAVVFCFYSLALSAINFIRRARIGSAPSLELSSSSRLRTPRLAIHPLLCPFWVVPFSFWQFLSTKYLLVAWCRINWELVIWLMPSQTHRPWQISIEINDLTPLLRISSLLQPATKTKENEENMFKKKIVLTFVLFTIWGMKIEEIKKKHHTFESFLSVNSSLILTYCHSRLFLIKRYNAYSIAPIFPILNMHNYLWFHLNIHVTHSHIISPLISPQPQPQFTKYNNSFSLRTTAKTSKRF